MRCPGPFGGVNAALPVSRISGRHVGFFDAVCKAYIEYRVLFLPACQTNAFPVYLGNSHETLPDKAFSSARH